MIEIIKDILLFTARVSVATILVWPPLFVYTFWKLAHNKERNKKLKWQIIIEVVCLIMMLLPAYSRFY